MNIPKLSALLLVGAAIGCGQNRPQSPLLNALDLDRDGIISATEIRDSATSLLTLDKNPDRRVLADDMVSTLMAFDKNKDGKLSRDELPERMQGIFDRGDTDKDGFLTPDEIRKMSAAQPSPEGRGGRPPDPLFAALDLDHDGVLSPDEIKRAPTSLLTLDKNGDGQLTPDEYRPRFGRGPGRPERL